MYRLGIHCKAALHRGLVRATPGVGVVAASLLVQQQHVRYTSSEPKRGADNNKKESEEEPVFDITKEWERATTEGVEYFKKWIVTDSDKQPEEKQSTTPASPVDLIKDIFQEKKNDTETDTKDDEAFSFGAMMKDVTSLVIGGGNEEQKEDAVKNLIQQARHSTSKGDIKDSTSFMEVLDILERHLTHLERTMTDAFGHIDFSKLLPTSAYYYLEREDEVKNPSWKRMKHRFHGGINIDKVKDLNAALYLAELSYDADTAEELQAGLKKTGEPVELVYSDSVSKPGRPAHFIVLKRDQSIWSSSLEVTLVVRGTRSPEDALTDCYLEAVDYRGGKAHSGILESGRYLVGEHKELLERLCKLAGKKKIKLTLIGHSLGAGAAAIAGIEFNDNPMIDARVIGFGTPSLLSRELSESTTSFIETVIADSDAVPRCNGVTLSNKILDIMEYDWTPKARRDLVHAFEELQRVAPKLATDERVDFIMDLVDSKFETYVKPTIKDETTERRKPVLFPPGKCIHFYRDGAGITGSESPCTFFDELDVSLTMVDDHKIDSGYRRIFLDIMRQYRRDHHFSFEEDQKK